MKSDYKPIFVHLTSYIDQIDPCRRRQECLILKMKNVLLQPGNAGTMNGGDPNGEICLKRIKLRNHYADMICSLYGAGLLIITGLVPEIAKARDGKRNLTLKG